MGEINVLFRLRGGNNFTNGRCDYTVMHKFRDETAVARHLGKDSDPAGTLAIAWKPS